MDNPFEEDYQKFAEFFDAKKFKDAAWVVYSAIINFNPTISSQNDLYEQLFLLMREFDSSESRPQSADAFCTFVAELIRDLLDGKVLNIQSRLN